MLFLITQKMLLLLHQPHPVILQRPFILSFTLLKWVNMLEIIFPLLSTTGHCQKLLKLHFHLCWKFSTVRSLP